MHQISNEFLTVDTVSLGAEMKSLFFKPDSQEWLWPGLPEFWARSSPVLFPIVGKLRDNTYTYNGQSYTMPQHGFARDQEFEIAHSGPGHVVYKLSSNDSLLESYPFPFELQIAYQLENNCVHVTYQVTNIGSETMYFSLGAHPGFNCKKPDSLKDTKAFIRMDMGRELLVYRLQNGLLGAEPSEGLMSTLDGLINLTDQLIENDAMVFKTPLGRWVDLRVPGVRNSLRLAAKGWPSYGIWSKTGAPFVCLEPWYGHADQVDATGDITQKVGILQLQTQQVWQATWSIEIRN